MSYARASAGRSRGPGGVGDAGEDIFASFDNRVFSRFLRFLTPHRAMLVGAMAAVLLSAAGTVALPYMIRRAVDAAVKAQNARLLDEVLIAFVVVAAANACATFLEQWATARLGQRVIFDIRRAMFVHLQDVSLSFMDRTHVGRIMARIQSDVNVLQEFLEGSIGAMAEALIWARILARALIS